MTATPLEESTLRRFVKKSETPMLALAGIAVAIYLVDVAGFWKQWGVQPTARAISGILDVAFVADLGLKVAAFGTAYLRTGWFFIDLVSSLPVVSTLGGLPSAARGLRVVRSLRILRILRSIRSLRM